MEISKKVFWWFTSKFNETNYIVGKNIRETILKNSGIMPEDMLTPDKSLKELEKDKNKKLLLWVVYNVFWLWVLILKSSLSSSSFVFDSGSWPLVNEFK